MRFCGPLFISVSSLQHYGTLLDPVLFFTQICSCNYKARLADAFCPEQPPSRSRMSAISKAQTREYIAKSLLTTKTRSCRNFFYFFFHRCRGRRGLATRHYKARKKKKKLYGGEEMRLVRPRVMPFASLNDYCPLCQDGYRPG